MFLRIEKGSAVPISRQIAEQIASLCASGSLQPGERLPSVRELARELAVNQNTILRVYERLCGEGLLEMRHGQGTFVAGAASRPAVAGASRSDWSTSCGRSRGRRSGSASSSDELHELLAEAADGVRASASRSPTNEEQTP